MNKLIKQVAATLSSKYHLKYPYVQYLVNLGMKQLGMTETETYKFWDDHKYFRNKDRIILDKLRKKIDERNKI